MAEFCLGCLNKHIENEKERFKEKDVTMSLDFCEECKEWKMCVVSVKKRRRIKRMLRNIIK